MVSSVWTDMHNYDWSWATTNDATRNLCANLNVYLFFPEVYGMTNSWCYS